jgi:hypothetical protein
MFRRFSSSSPERTFGDIPFIVFYHTVLARLAYYTSEHFIQAYLEIFGKIIPVHLMESINNAVLDSTIFDTSIYKLDDYPDIPIYMNENEKMIDFTKMAEQINDITSRRSKSTIKGETEISIGDEKVAYVSISTSNYGGYYILVDSRMPTSIFVVFRGTYSAKSAGSYTKPSSLVPTKIGTDLPKDQLKRKLEEDQGKMYGVLIGIEKILDDVYHTIIESMVYLSKKYLKAKDPGSIKVFTTGHSLGGGLCTLFTNNWYELTRSTPYNQAPYNVFSEKICCISIASPRVMSPGLTNNFCSKVDKGTILYKRLANRGDPVPVLPKKAIIGLTEGFDHPCSAKKYAKTKQALTDMNCSNALKMRPVLKTDYSVSLKCADSKSRFSIDANPLAHTSYLYINFVNAVPVSEFLLSSMPSIVKKRLIEIERGKKGETIARIILGENISSKELQFKSMYFTLNDLRPKGKDIISMDPNKPPALSGDTLMNANIFNQQIIENMTVIPSGSSLNEVKYDELTSIQGAKIAMPDVDGIVDDKVGGRKKKRRTRKKRSSRKRQSKKISSKKRHSRKRR